jgi:hypothetical protein
MMRERRAKGSRVESERQRYKKKLPQPATEPCRLVTVVFLDHYCGRSLLLIQ